MTVCQQTHEFCVGITWDELAWDYLGIPVIVLGERNLTLGNMIIHGNDMATDTSWK